MARILPPLVPKAPQKGSGEFRSVPVGALFEDKNNFPARIILRFFQELRHSYLVSVQAFASYRPKSDTCATKLVKYVMKNNDTLLSISDFPPQNVKSNFSLFLV